MTNTINRRAVVAGAVAVLAATPAIAKQSRDNDRELAKASAQWCGAEKLYYDTPEDVTDEMSDEIVRQQHPLEITLATTPADTWAGVRCKIDWLEHPSNSPFVWTGNCNDILKSVFADVVRLSI